MHSEAAERKKGGENAASSLGFASEWDPVRDNASQIGTPLKLPIKGERSCIRILTVVTEPCLSADSNTTPARSLAHALTLATQIKFHGPINFPSRRFARALAHSFARNAASGSSESVRGRFIRLGNDGERASGRKATVPLSPSLTAPTARPPPHMVVYKREGDK